VRDTKKPYAREAERGRADGDEVTEGMGAGEHRIHGHILTVSRTRCSVLEGAEVRRNPLESAAAKERMRS